MHVLLSAAAADSMLWHKSCLNQAESWWKYPPSWPVINSHATNILPPPPTLHPVIRGAPAGGGGGGGKRALNRYVLLQSNKKWRFILKKYIFWIFFLNLNYCVQSSIASKFSWLDPEADIPPEAAWQPLHVLQSRGITTGYSFFRTKIREIKLSNRLQFRTAGLQLSLYFTLDTCGFFPTTHSVFLYFTIPVRLYNCRHSRQREVGRVLPTDNEGGTDPSITNIYSLGTVTL